MISKISNWFSDGDEKFLLALKDEHKRTELLSQLYRFKITCIFFALLFLILFFVLITLDSNASDERQGLLFVFVLQMMLCFHVDSKIRTIRLYELLLTTDKGFNQSQ